jgi:hypothetical protein
MAIPALFPVVCNLEANTVGALEERRGVVICVLRIPPSFCGVNPERTKLIRNGVNISRGVHAQTKMMKTWRIRFVPR